MLRGGGLSMFPCESAARSSCLSRFTAVEARNGRMLRPKARASWFHCAGASFHVAEIPPKRCRQQGQNPAVFLPLGSELGQLVRRRLHLGVAVRQAKDGSVDRPFFDLDGFP